MTAVTKILKLLLRKKRMNKEELKIELEKALNLIESLEEEKRHLEWLIEDMKDLDNEAGN